jgi:hypothetical protein
MMKEQPTVKIPLTKEQQEQIRQATGREVATLKLQPLEGRLVPYRRMN